MESRANYALVGLFTLAVLAAMFGFVYWFNTGLAGRKQEVRIIFSGTVTGLGRGSSVLFNGLRVGEVTRIRLLPEDPRRIYAIVQIENSTPLRLDTRARIEAQGLAGVVAVQLIGGDPDSPPLEAQPGQDMPVIVAERSEFQDIIETVRTVARRADEVLGSVEGLVKENAGSISNTVRNVEEFSIALNRNSAGVEKAMASFASAAETVGPLSQKLGKLSDDLSELSRAIDGKKIANIVDNVDKFSSTLGGSSSDAGKLIKDAAALAEKLNKSADQIDGVLKAAQGFLNTSDGQGAFAEVASAARSVRTLADNLDKRTAEITSGINRFTGPGLRDIENLTAEGRRTLTDFSRTLRNIERNPQQFLFGSRPPLPQYGGTR